MAYDIICLRSLIATYFNENSAILSQKRAKVSQLNAYDVNTNLVTYKRK